MDWTLFQRVNDFQQHTGWAHGIMRDFAKYGVVIFAGLLLVAGVMSLRRGPRAVARSLWAAGAALVALVLNQPIANAVDRARPYAAHPTSTYSSPKVLTRHS
jgi:undecaprenyl-diphosphatase